MNEDLVDPKAKFTITFEGAMDYLNVRVLPEKQEGADFIFATKDMWRIFEKYDKIAVRRLVVDTLDGPKVEIHLLKVFMSRRS